MTMKFSERSCSRERPFSRPAVGSDLSTRADAPWSLDEIAHLQRLAVVGELCAETAHEVNQPLTAIRWFAEGALHQLRKAREKGEPPSKQLEETLETIVGQSELAQQLTGRLFGMARRQDDESAEATLGDAWETVEPMLRILAERYHVELVVSGLEELPPVQGDRLQLGQVLMNLVRNAIEAVALQSDDRKRVEIRGSVVGSRIEVAVIDRGEGAEPEVLERMFDRFYTTKLAGTGLGLAITKSIVEAHGGEIEAEPNRDVGLTVRFWLPRSEKS